MEEHRMTCVTNKKIALGLLLLLATHASGSFVAQLRYDSNEPAVVFAAAEIQRAATGAKSDGRATIELATDPGRGLSAQGYLVEKPGPNALKIIGGSPVGTMYGGLDAAEAIRLGTLADLKEGKREPFIRYRGIKFNIPLDLRTPSYSDNSDAFQANIPEMWSFDFWREFLDEMARHRFNVLTLWNLHPFPSIVKVPEYPEVALKDVLRGRRECFNENFPHSGRDMFKPEFLRGAEVVKRMTIEEKIEFWRRVMQWAKDRGIDVYWFTWNTFLYGAEGRHGLSRSNADQNMIRYFRASVREAVKTYPLLAGIGITAGEFMEKEMAGLSKEQWLWQTYGEGIRDALREQPHRPFRLIHRLHQTNLDEIRAAWREFPGAFELSYKYAVAHMYASTRPKFIDPLLEQLPTDMRLWLTVRNDDIYSFRWGDIGFARQFIRQLPGPDKVCGFYMGPDGYCWGREAMDKEPESPRQLVMQKQWFSFMLWGRLSYDPNLAESHFKRVLAHRFPEVPADKLLEAWTAASKIFPEITRFFWGNIDLRWFPEACLSHPKVKGFYTVRDFVEGDTMPGEKNINIRRWREAVLKKADVKDAITPPQVAANLRTHASCALNGAAELRPLQAANKELRLTLGDIESFGHIGNCYAAKIEAACELALYDASGRPEHQHSAIRHLESALEHWKRYAASYTRRYHQPLLYNRVGWVDIPALTEKVAADIEIARQWQPGTVPRQRSDRGKRRSAGNGRAPVIAP